VNPEKFFQTVLPSEGLRCVINPNGKGFGFKHATYATNSSALEISRWHYAKLKKDSFFACFSLKKEFILRENAIDVEKKMYRVRENLHSAKSFWLHLDVEAGNPKKYETQQAAVNHLFEFLAATKLPVPILVNSGYGAHVYFPLTEAIGPEIWTKVAWALHSLVEGYGLKADKSRTHDAASILRPIGSYNLKDPANPKMVEAIHTEYEVTSVQDFAGRIVTAIKAVRAPVMSAPAPRSAAPVATVETNNELMGGIYVNDSSAHRMANGCAAAAKMRETRGNVQEPLWYAMIGVLRHTIEGDQIIHEWSNGHPGYTQEDTDMKIAQHEASGFGPSTCAHIMGSTEASDLCNACPQYGHITSPIQLGKPVATIVEPESIVVEDIEAPFESRDIGMFELTAAGVVYKDSFDPGHKVEEESKVLVLDYPLMIKSSAEDERKGGVIEVEYLHPSKGKSSFYMEKSTLAEKTVFYKELLRNHITVSAGKVDLMKQYMTTYLQDLDKTAELQMLYSTMGWKDKDGFVLGSRFLRKDSPIQDSNLSMHLEGNYCNAIKEVGDWREWSDMTKLLDVPGLENHALSLLMGFGAPLTPMTGYDGILINLLGATNSGKSTMLELITSIYGDYKDLKAQKEDTYNSLIGRLGTLNNLPMVIDEITNIDFRDVSDLVYSISQGREKTRMTAKITDRKPRTWSTLVLSSSNASLGDKLMAAKSDPEAEKMRLIEYWIATNPVFDGIVSQLHPVMKSNYGGAGTVYLQYVLNNYEAIAKFREGVEKKLKESSQALGKERYWVAAFSAALTGGYVAKQIGLVQLDMGKMFNHVVGMMKGMRGDVVADEVSYMSVLGRFLNNHSSNVMLVRYGRNHKKVVEAVFEPQRELIVRVEHDHVGKRVFIDKQSLIRWLNKVDISTTAFVQDTKKSGLMISLNTSKVLGQDWINNPNNAPVPTMEFYLKDTDEAAEILDNNVLAMVK